MEQKRTIITQDRANVMRQMAETVAVLIHAGFTKRSAVTAVMNGDFSELLGGEPPALVDASALVEALNALTTEVLDD